MKKIEPILKNGFFVVNNRYYQIEGKDGQPILKEINKKKVDEAEEMAEKLAEKLKESLNKEAILKEAIMKLEFKDIKKLFNLMFKSKKRYKPITREEHCVDMKIGRFILPIIE